MNPCCDAGFVGGLPICRNGSLHAFSRQAPNRAGDLIPPHSPMPPQETDLERRVLAHERILQFLLAELAQADPSLADRLTTAFWPKSRNSHQHDHTDAEDYAEAFVRQVLKLNEQRSDLPSRPPSLAMTSSRTEPPIATNEIPVVVKPRSGVWEVSRARRHIGDYMDRSAAFETALAIALEDIQAGVKATLVVDGVAVPIGAAAKPQGQAND